MNVVVNVVVNVVLVKYYYNGEKRRAGELLRSKSQKLSLDALSLSSIIMSSALVKKKICLIQSAHKKLPSHKRKCLDTVRTFLSSLSLVSLSSFIKDSSAMISVFSL